MAENQNDTARSEVRSDDTAHKHNTGGLSDRQNRILSAISHDLKSPINAISGFAQLLRRDLGNLRPSTASAELTPQMLAKWESFLDRIISASGDLTGLVTDILTMARIEAGHDSIEPEWEYDIGAKLRESLMTFRLEAEAKSITIDCRIGKEASPVKCDFRRIKLHVINNLLSNALRFTPSGGKILVAAEPVGDMLRIRVADTGAGIPRHERDRVFNRFAQVDLKSQRVFSNAGLGLATAKWVVEQHGGSIYIDNPIEGFPGANFVVDIPQEAGGDND